MFNGEETQEPQQEESSTEDEGSCVVKINTPLQDAKLFDSAMQDLGYELMSDSFLVKSFNGIEINITRRNQEVDSITGYKNYEIVPIPEEVINQVKNDIQQSL